MYKLVISLTTIPSRMYLLNYTLDSLKNQSIKPDAIILNIPHMSVRFNIEYNIPNWLLNDHNIEIHRCEDFGPGTKLLGLFSHPKIDDNTMLCIVDDDRLYPNNIVDTLVNFSNKYPTATIGYMAGLIDETKREDAQAIKIQGCSGFLTRKKYFTDDIYECTRRNFRYVDDDYISLHILKNGYIIWSVIGAHLWEEIGEPPRTDNDIFNPLSHLQNGLNREFLIGQCNEWFEKTYGFSYGTYINNLKNSI